MPVQVPPPPTHLPTNRSPFKHRAGGAGSTCPGPTLGGYLISSLCNAASHDASTHTHTHTHTHTQTHKQKHTHTHTHTYAHTHTHAHTRTHTHTHAHTHTHKYTNTHTPLAQGSTVTCNFCLPPPQEQAASAIPLPSARNARKIRQVVPCTLFCSGAKLLVL